MLNEKDFRIGNLLKDSLTGALLSVSDLNKEGSVIGFQVDDLWKFPLPDGWQAEPIPLSNEILQDWGFEYKDYVNQDRDDIEWLEHPKMEGYSYRDGVFSIWMMRGRVELKNIKYLHQLQNLFHALVGEELNVQLNDGHKK